VHESTEVVEDLRELMDASLYLTDFLLALLDERLLISKLMWRQLLLKKLRLPLFGCVVIVLLLPPGHINDDAAGTR
jgi:hypothetical protein